MSSIFLSFNVYHLQLFLAPIVDITLRNTISIASKRNRFTPSAPSPIRPHALRAPTSALPAARSSATPALQRRFWCAESASAEVVQWAMGCYGSSCRGLTVGPVEDPWGLGDLDIFTDKRHSKTGSWATLDISGLSGLFGPCTQLGHSGQSFLSTKQDPQHVLAKQKSWMTIQEPAKDLTWHEKGLRKCTLSGCWLRQFLLNGTETSHALQFHAQSSISATIDQDNLLKYGWKRIRSHFSKQKPVLQTWCFQPRSCLSRFWQVWTLPPCRESKV